MLDIQEAVDSSVVNNSESENTANKELLSIVGLEPITQVIKNALVLESEIANARQDLQNLYQKAKLDGFDVPTLKKIIKMEKTDRGAEKYNEFANIVQTYWQAITTTE